MFSFLKRQLATKTGRLATAVIAATIGTTVTPEAGEAVTKVVEVVGTVANPTTAVIGLLGMFLRDSAAKRGE